METTKNINAGSGSPPLPGSAVRAYEVKVTDWPEATSIHAAASPSKAKYQSWRSAQEAGYEFVTFGRLRVRRAPEFDGIAAKLKHGVDREYALLLRQSGEHSNTPTQNP